MSKKTLREQTACVILKVGDIVIDTITDHGGTLIRRKHHIDIEKDDVYLWEIKWFNNDSTTMHPAQYIAEDSLKLSIVVGTYKWHSVNGGTYELECV